MPIYYISTEQLLKHEVWIQQTSQYVKPHHRLQNLDFENSTLQSIFSLKLVRESEKEKLNKNYLTHLIEIKDDKYLLKPNNLLQFGPYY